MMTAHNLRTPILRVLIGVSRVALMKNFEVIVTLVRGLVSPLLRMASSSELLVYEKRHTPFINIVDSPAHI